MLTSEYMKVGEKNISKKQLTRYTIVMIIIGSLILITGFVKDTDGLKGLGNLILIIIFLLWIYKYVLYQASNWFQEKFLPKLEDKYERFLSKALSGYFPGFVVLGTILLFVFSVVLLIIFPPKVLFFPESQPNQIFVYIEYPEGTDIEKTNEITKEIENNVFNVLDKYTVKEKGEDYNYMVESIVTQAGKGATNPQIDAGSSAETPHKGKITVLLREFKHRRGIISSKVLQEVRASVQNFAGVSIIVEKEPTGPPAGYPINIEISGNDYHQMMDESERIIEEINGFELEGVEALKIDVSRDFPELLVNVNRSTAGELGITNQMVGATLRRSIYGWEASRYKPENEEDDYQINIRLKKDQRYNNGILFNQPVTFTNPTNGKILSVPISSVSTQKKTKAFTKIKHEDFKKTITVYSNTKGGANANALVNNIKQKLQNYKMPKGISYKFTGEQEAQEANQDFLLKALVIGIVAIILIIVLQFNSISRPIIILISVFFSFIGVFLGLVIFRDEFVILMTMLGIISLAGIVVNNSIVLIDYTDLLLNNKKRELNTPEGVMLPKNEIRDAIIAGGKSRLRPVLLTAITTILGLIPLAIGLNINFFTLFTAYNPKIYFGGDNLAFWGPLARTVIYGLTFATFLTLVIVPVLFYLINLLKLKIKINK